MKTLAWVAVALVAMGTGAWVARWDVQVTGQTAIGYRLDRWTGQTELLLGDHAKAVRPAGSTAVDVPGVGIVVFPPGVSDDVMSAGSKALYEAQQAWRTTHPRFQLEDDLGLRTGR